MPVYNGEHYVLQSVLSVLAQTFEKFELLVVDDCSTDRTAEILASVQDRRLRVLRNEANLGIVGSLNRAMAETRGQYIARIDADDYCLPTRFARQKHYLDTHPEILLLGTETFDLEGGRPRPSRHQADPDPAVLRWQFLVSNPVGHTTMMFRAEAVTLVGEYLREPYKYAEDFDFSHRVLQMGNIAVLPNRLAIYRRHQGNVTRTRRAEMVAKAAAVLDNAYRALLGQDCAAEAILAAEHFMAGDPVRCLPVLERLGDLLERLVTSFVSAQALDDARAAQVVAHAGALWWTTVQASLRAGAVVPAALGHDRFRWGRETRPALYQLARSAASGLLGGNHLVQRLRGTSGTVSRRVPADTAVEIGGIRFDPVPICRDDPPVLYVVVDAGAESGRAAPDRTQDIYDCFGMRPVYAVDYAVASQAVGYEPLRRILGRHACVIGAQLHPGVNPPFDAVPPGDSYDAGNGTAGLEERKLRALVGVIQSNFQVSPLFFKAGRAGLEPRMIETLARLGFAVDFSLLPATGRGAGHGVDARPYRAAAGGILSVPVMRAQLEPLAPSFLLRFGLTSTVALTPEEMTAGKQIRLIRAMVKRGYRTFTLHHSSLSSTAGHTSYAGSSAETDVVLQRIEAVCRFFVEELGGMPGNPVDLVSPEMRGHIWPRCYAASELR